MEVEAGVSGLAVMLAIAASALVLGVLALWLARRRTHQARRDGERREPDDPS